jgi:hypothetical protein
MMELKPGLRLRSAVCDAEVMVIKAAAGDGLTCGGESLLEQAQDAKAAASPEHMHGCVIGKRYVNEAQTIELLCIKSGEGSLYYNGDELMTKDTKKLPSSD